MRIFGTIRNSRSRAPVKSVKIKLGTANTEIASIYSDDYGGFEYNIETGSIGQTLDLIIEKKGFASKSFSYEIDRPEIQADILLEEYEVEIKGEEKKVLCDLLDEGDYSYTVEKDRIIISLKYTKGIFKEEEGIEIFDAGTEIKFIATWRKDRIRIGMPLLKLDRNNQKNLNPKLMQALLEANYKLDICKFAFDPNALSIFVDLDARNLQCEEIKSGIESLLTGLELYLIKILPEWSKYLKERGELLFEVREEDKKLYDELEIISEKAGELLFEENDEELEWIDEKKKNEELKIVDKQKINEELEIVYEKINKKSELSENYSLEFYKEKVSKWVGALDTIKGQIISAIAGIANLGIRSAVVAAIAVLMGVPTTGLGDIIAATVAIT